MATIREVAREGVRQGIPLEVLLGAHPRGAVVSRERRLEEALCHLADELPNEHFLKVARCFLHARWGLGRCGRFALKGGEAG